MPDRWHRSASSGRSIWSNGSRGPRLYVYVGQAKLIGKRGHTGIYHRMSPKRLQRSVNEFAGRHNLRDTDTIEQMAMIARGTGRQISYSTPAED